MTTVGRIIGGAPETSYYGSVLTAAATAGDTVLNVDDVGDFDEDAPLNGGRLVIGADVDDDGNIDITTGTILPYLTCDDDAGTVTLVDPLPADLDAADSIYLYDPATGDVVADAIVYVEIEGADVSGDALAAIVSYGILGKIGDSDDDANGLVVTLEVDEDDQLTVVDVHGSDKASDGVKAWQDQFTVTAPGDQEFTLTYKPIENSEHFYWHPGGGAGVYQPGDQWSRSGWDVTVPDADGLFEVDDVVVIEYLYRDPSTKPFIPAFLTLIGANHVVTGATEIALPPLTAVGDLIVLGIIGHAITPSDCPDDRMIASHTEILNPSSPTVSGYLGYGIEDGSGDPLPLTLPAASRAEVAVFRFSGDIDDVYSPFSGSNAPHIPAVPGGDVGVAVLIGVCHVVPSGFDDDTTGEWTTVSPSFHSGGTSDASSLIAYCLTGTPVGSWPGLDLDPRWAAMVIGITGG